MVPNKIANKRKYVYIYSGGVWSISEATDSKRERRIKGPEY